MAIQLITLEEYFMGRDKAYPPSEQMRRSAIDLVSKTNQLLTLFGQYRKVSSGYRPATVNSKVPGAAKRSNHIICCAVDLEDSDGKLYAWCVKNKDALIKFGLYMEANTKGWVHLQCVPPKSGSRIFFA